MSIPADGDVPARGRAETPAFSAVYREYFAFVWRTARQLGVHESALEDVTHEVFIVVYRKLPAFEGRSSVQSWLYGIARRVASRHRRSQARAARKEIAAAHVADQTRPQSGSVAERAEAADLVHRFLAVLEPDQREVFVLTEVEGMTAAAISGALGVKQNTVYSRLRLARDRFRAFVARQTGDVQGRLDDG